MDVFDTLDAPPKPDVFDELDAPKADVFDEVAAPAVSTPEKQAVLSGILSGSTPVPETPTLSEEDPRFPEVAAGVESAKVVMDQILLPAKIDAFKLLNQAEREQQTLAARVEGLKAERDLQNLPADAPMNVFQEVRQRAIDARLRGEAMQSRTDEQRMRTGQMTGMERYRFDQQKALENKQSEINRMNAEGEVPGFLSTALSSLTSSLAGSGAEVLRDIAPSIGTAPYEALNEVAGQEREMSQLNAGISGKLGRGVASPAFLLAGNPAGKAGLAIATLKGALDTRNQVFQQTGDRTEADHAALETYPTLGIYILTGMAAAKGAAAMVPVNSAPMIKGLAGFGAAGAANVGTSAVIHAINDEEYGLETFTADTLMAFVQAKGEYSNAVTERGQKRAEAELLSRGFSEQQLQQPFDFRGETPASRLIPAPEKVQPFAADEVTPTSQQQRQAPTPDTEPPAPAEEVVPKSEGSVPAEEPIARNLGPGAANIEEFGEGVKVGAYNAKVDEQRAARGLEPLMSEARKADETTWQNVENRVEADAEWPRRVADEINAGEKKGVTDEEQAGLLWRMIDLRNKRDDADVRAQDELTYSPEERADFEAQAKDYERQLQQTEDADRKAGTQQGRALRIRRLLAYEDFTLAGMERRAREAKGDALTPQERGELGTLATKAEQAKKTLEDREYAAESGIDESIREIERNTEPDADFPPEVKSIAQRIIDRLDTAAASALKRLKAKGLAQLGSAPDPTILVDAAIWGAAKLGKGILNKARWTASMLKDLGAWVKPHLDSLWEKVNADIDANVARAVPDKAKRAKVKAAITKEKTAATAETIGEKMKERVGAGGKLTDLRGSIRQLVEMLVRGGIKKREPLVDAVHEVLKGVDPTVTRRQTMDAISGYGDFKPLNPDAIKAEVRDLRQQLQQVGKLQDLEAKQPLKRTGIERQPPSDEGRALIKQVNEMAKKMGVTVTDPATQLKTILGSIETRLTNRIADLRAELAAGERAVKSKTPAPSNEKIAALRKELAEVEAEHEAAFGKRQMTDEQRLKAAIASAKRAEQAEAGRLEKAKLGVFEKPINKPEQKSAELDAIRARTEAAREERKALEDAANPPLSDAQKRLDAALVVKERWGQLLAGEIAPAKKLPREALTQLEEDARAEISAMRELAAEIRKSERPKTDPEIAKESAAVKALEKAAAEYERRVNEADFSSKIARLGPDTAKVAQARALRDAARAAYDAAADARKPVRTKEQIAIQSMKARAARKISELQDRIAVEDFGPRPKRKPMDLSRDPEAVRAKAELERVKGEFEIKKVKWERARRFAGQKFFDVVGDLVGASRSLKTSFDISAPFRQGGFLSIGDLVFAPRRFTTQFRKMLGSFKSTKTFDDLQASFQLRPNAELYQQSGLYLADVGTKMTNREENMRSNLAELVPGVKASNRAYVAFLNQQRADAFDSFVSMMGGKEAVTPEQAKFLAKAVNDLTGRGDLKPQYAGAANFLAKYLFSPRFLLSRIKTVLGVPVFRGLLSGEKVGFKARAIVAAQYGKFVTGLAAVYGLSKLAGATVEDDPRSSDFGKMRFGKTRIDPMAGLQQVATFMSRVLTRSVVDGGGRERPLTGTTLGNFARSKLAPIPGTAVDVALGRNVVGEEVTPQSAAVGLVAPLSVPAEIGAIYEEQGPVKATVLQLLNLMGAGMQHY